MAGFFLFSSLLAPVICLCTLCLILSLLLSTNCCLSTMMMMMMMLLLLLLLFSCDGSISVDPMAFLCFLPIHPFLIIYSCAFCLGMGNGNDGAGCQLWLLSFCYLLLFPFSLVLFSFFSPFCFPLLKNIPYDGSCCFCCYFMLTLMKGFYRVLNCNSLFYILFLQPVIF